MTQLQKTLIKYASSKLDSTTYSKIKADTKKIIGHGMSQDYYNRTFGKNGWTKDFSKLSRFINDAVHSTGSFDPINIATGGKRHNW